MAKLYIKQHKRGRKSYYTGIPRGSSIFCCFGALWGFSADFSATLEEIRKKTRKGAKNGENRAFPPLAASNKQKVFFWRPASEKSRFFERIKCWSARSGAFWAFSGRKGAFIHWSKKSADLNDLPRRVGLLWARSGGLWRIL